MPDVLPDVLGWGLRIVFCGTAAGPESARIGAYYAGPRNAFWPTLAEAGFTPGLIRPAEYAALPGLGIGLTDLCKTRSGVDRALAPEDFAIDRFWAAMRLHAPRAIAFTSQEAGAIALGRRKREVPFGAQPSMEGRPPVFVLPSPSGANGHWAALRHHWHGCARQAGFA
jgi:TDG/mug DNA glycosylase family protein